jgi:glycosyltransferase involved in cell wall biosynthesis
VSADLPSITVVTSSFNQGAFLERTIRSVLDQGYPKLEYFVLDGGSTDRSDEIIRRHADRIDYWVSQPDGGQTAAINEGWRRATGEILAWLNSDDYYLPGALATVGRAFLDHPGAALVYGQMRREDPDGRPLGTLGSAFDRRRLLYSHQMIPQPSAFFRRAGVEAAGPLDESLHYSMDYDFLLRLTSVGPTVMIPEPLAVATIHAQAKTTRDRAAAAAETNRVRRRYARGAGWLLVRLQPLLSWSYHRLPSAMRRLVDRLRPRRVYVG